MVSLVLIGEAALGSPNFVTRVWLRENGLPQNKVAAVQQTHAAVLELKKNSNISN